MSLNAKPTNQEEIFTQAPMRGQRVEKFFFAFLGLFHIAVRLAQRPLRLQKAMILSKELGLFSISTAAEKAGGKETEHHGYTPIEITWRKSMGIGSNSPIAHDFQLPGQVVYSITAPDG